MKDVEVKFTGSAKAFSVVIDNQKLQFQQDTARLRLAPRRDYRMQWFVLGPPGARYTIRVTDPPEAQFTHSNTLDFSMKDAGSLIFEIEGEPRQWQNGEHA